MKDDLALGKPDRLNRKCKREGAERGLNIRRLKAERRVYVLESKASGSMKPIIEGFECYNQSEWWRS